MAQGRLAVFKRRAKAPKVLRIVLVTEHTLGVTRNYPLKTSFPGSVLNLSTRSNPQVASLVSNQKAKVRAYWWRKRNTHDGGVLQARIDGPVPSVVTGGGVTPNDDGVFRARINGPVPSVATG